MDEYLGNIFWAEIYLNSVNPKTADGAD
jgi:hypothetical protein